MLRYLAIKVRILTEMHLETPLSEPGVRGLKIGDTVYISGMVVTARDQAHLRAIKESREGRPVPVDFKGIAIYHCGPIAKQVDDSWRIIAAGPTSSYRMEEMEAEFIERFGIRMIIGKGGMGKKTSDALRTFGAVYCDFTGGAALLAARAIVEVEGVEWLDLGTPEAMWRFSVRDLGPLLVTMDAAGSNYRTRTR